MQPSKTLEQLRPWRISKMVMVTAIFVRGSGHSSVALHLRCRVAAFNYERRSCLKRGLRLLRRDAAHFLARAAELKLSVGFSRSGEILGHARARSAETVKHPSRCHGRVGVSASPPSFVSAGQGQNAGVLPLAADRQGPRGE